MLKIGLTGNIGSGKTTVARVFVQLGVPVFFADYEARQCYFEPDVKEQIMSAFGEESYLSENKINAPHIAGIVFSDAVALEKLNTIIHPALKERFNAWCIEHEKNEMPYVIMEAAILFENNFDVLVDTTVCVYASRKQRIKRVLRRDALSVEQIKLRMDKQWSDKKIMEQSDYCINNKNKKMILSEVLELHETFIRESRGV